MAVGDELNLDTVFGQASTRLSQTNPPQQGANTGGTIDLDQVFPESPSGQSDQGVPADPGIVNLDDAYAAPPPEDEVQTFGRFRHGINAVLKAGGKALLQDLPQAGSVLFHDFRNTGREAEILGKARLAKREALGVPVGVGFRKDLELTPQEKEKALAEGDLFVFADLDNDPVFQFGKRMGEAVEEMFPGNPKFQGEILADVVPTAIGQLGSLVIGRGAASLASKGAGSLVASSIGVSQVAAPEFREAVKKGATEEEAFQTFLLNIPVGLTEKIPVGTMFRRLDKVTGGGVKKVLAGSFKGGLEELVQESIQTASSNVIAGNIYDQNREILDGLGDAAQGGFAAGLVLNALGLSVKQGFSNPGDSDISASESADTDLAIDELDAEFKAGVARGDIDLVDVVDWETFKVEQQEGIRETDPGQLKDPNADNNLLLQTDINPETGAANSSIRADLEANGIVFVTEEELAAEAETARLKTEREGRVIGTSKISENLIGFADDIHKTFGITRQIKIVDVTEVVFSDLTRELPTSIVDQVRGSLSAGAYFFDSLLDEHYIFVNSTQTPARLGEVISHEIGHLVAAELQLSDQHTEAINELELVHKQAISELKNENLRDVMLSYRTPINSLNLYKSLLEAGAKRGESAADLDSRTFGELEDLHKKHYDYMTSYDEWFADQFSKWVATAPGKRNTTTKIGQYFKALFDRLQQVYAHFKGAGEIAPDIRFENWIEGFIVPQAQTQTQINNSTTEQGQLHFSQDIPPERRAGGDPNRLPVRRQDNSIRGREAEFDAQDPTHISKSFGINPDDDLPQWKRFLKKWLIPEGLLSKEAFEEARKGQAFATRESREAHARVNEVMAEIGGIKNMTPQLQAEIDVVMRGAPTRVRRLLNGPTLMTPELAAKLVDARRHIDRLSVSLIREGYIEGPLAARVAANVGTYLHRQYKVHVDPKWAKNVPNAVMQRARAFIQEKMRDSNGGRLNSVEVTNVINQLLHNNEFQRDLLLGTKLSQFDAGILRSRSGVPPEIRALWGEIKDPLYNYMESVRKIANLLGDQRAVTQIRNMGEGTLFFRQGEFFHPEGYDETIQAGPENLLSPLAGWKTHPDILESLRDAFGDIDPVRSRWTKAYLKLNGAAKLSKTVLSPITHSRNFFGGTMFLMANGHGLGAAVKHGTRVFKTLSDSSVNARKLRYAGLDLLDQSIISGELDDVLRDMGADWDSSNFLSNFDAFSSRYQKGLKKYVNKPLQQAIRLYQAEDNVLRITMFEAELAKQRKAAFGDRKPQLHELEILEEQVAQQIRDTYPNYSRVPRAIRGLRRNVFVGPFVSFPYEAIRTAWNTAKYAKRMMASDNPAIRKLGRQKAFSLAAMLASGPAMTLVSMANQGISDETEDDINSLLPPWDKNGPKWYYSTGAGKVSYFNIGYTMPYDIIQRPVMTLLFSNEESALKSANEALTQFGSNFLGLELTTKALGEIFANEKESGAWITNPVAPRGEQLADKAMHLFKTFEPGVMRDFVSKPIKANAREEDFSYSEEALETLFGLRAVELDVNKSFMFKSREFNQGRRNAKALATGVLRNTSDPIERAEAIAKAQKVYRGQWDDLQSLYDSAFRLGVSHSELRMSLSEAGVGKKLQRDLLTQRFRPLEF